MGLIERSMEILFGGTNVVAETAEVFRENAENRAERTHRLREHALGQFATEFAPRDCGRFDRLMDGINRLPRPALALGTLGLFTAAMVDPDWFAERMVGLGYVPEPLWWLLGAIVSFYFGARHQAKGQEFRRDVLRTAAVATTRADALGAEPDRDIRDDPATPSGNAALDEWRQGRGQ